MTDSRVYRVADPFSITPAIAPTARTGNVIFRRIAQNIQLLHQGHFLHDPHPVLHSADRGS